MIPFSNRVPEEDHRAFLIDAVSASYYGLYIGFLLPFIPVLMKRIGADPFQMGLCIAAPFLALVMSFPILPHLSGFRALELVSVPCLIARPAVALIGLCTNPWLILGIYMVNQLVEGLGLAPYTRLLKSMYSDRGRSSAMGFVRTYQAIFQIAAAALGGMMIDRGMLLLTLTLSGLSGFISAANFLRVLPREVSPIYTASVYTPYDVYRTVIDCEPFYWLNVTLMLFGFGNLLVVGVLPTVLVEHFSISNTSLGILNGCTNIMLVMCYAIIGRFIYRFGPQRGMLLALTAGMLIPWLVLLAPRTGYLAIPYLLYGIMNAGVDLSWLLCIIAFVPADLIGSYAAIYTLMMGLRGFIVTMFSNLALPVIGPFVFLFIAGLFTTAGVAIGAINRQRWRAQ
ncbi:MAG: MFS transporter [Candidatus Riflebacteria bacterium]|nr:MFS transporter [Candidatus Riflebacteria bacterium]